MSCSWVVRLNVVKMSVFLKLIYRFNTIQIKTAASFLEELDKSNLLVCPETHMEMQRT